MRTCLPKVSSICYSVGKIRPIAALLDSGVDQGALDSLAAKGIQNFCEDSRAAHDMCMACVKDTLSESGLRASDINAVVIGPSRAKWDLAAEQSLLAALASIGLSRMQACSVANAALDLARLLVLAHSKVKNVLVIVFGKNDEDSRLAPEAATLFSDGAVSCIVSSDFGNLEIVGAASATDPALAALEWTGSNFGRYLQSGIASLHAVCVSVYEQGQVAPRDIAAVFGTNGSSIYLQMIGFAAEVPSDRVYSENLSRYGHVYGCDNLIGIRDRMLAQDFDSGAHVISVAWAPNVASACLLRRV
jgi:3-oxoacyl-[acyl-carrier-protein] synthase III